MIYGAITWVRNKLFDIGWLPSTEFPVPVICVGNISVGGTGKTPHTEWLIRLLADQHIVVLSRGYGRKTKGFYWVHPTSASTEVGDEPLQMKLAFPNVSVAVCEKRVDGVQTILKEQPETNVIILDDAFQHRYIKPSLSILLNDYNHPIYADWMLPLGRKREFSSGRKRADVVVVTKCPSEIDLHERNTIQQKLDVDVPVFFSRFQYQQIVQLKTGVESKIESNTQIVLVTGIVNPTPILEYLTEFSVTHVAFRDHHAFSASEISEIKDTFEAIHSENKIILTTAKDASRLIAFEENFGKSYEHIYSLPIKVTFVDGKLNEFKKIIENHVSKS